MTDAELIAILQPLVDSLDKPKLSNKTQQIDTQKYLKMCTNLEKILKTLQEREDFVPGTMMF